MQNTLTKIEIMSCRIEKALASYGLLLKAPSTPMHFSHVSYNSNDIIDGTLFICKGFRFKAEYLLDAVMKGATCYVSEHEYDLSVPCFIVTDSRKAMAVIAREVYGDGIDKLTLIAVTGSKGKTTTTRFLFDALFAASGGKAAYTSTAGYYDGSSFGDNATHNTTMESLETFKIIRNAIDSGAEYMVVEASSQAAKLDRLYGIEFDYGIFTNIDRDHISPNEHCNFKEYLNAKIDILKQCKVVLANHNLLLKHPIIIDKLRQKKVKILTFGTFDKCDFQAEQVNELGNGYEFVLKDNRGPYSVSYKVHFALFGEYNVLNATAASGIALLINPKGLDLYTSFAKTQIEGRSDFIEGFLCPVIVDSAHNRLSAYEFFNALSNKYPSSKIVAVFGCPGNKGINRRKDLGEIVGSFASYIYVTTEDSADEAFEDIANEIIANFPKGVAYSSIEDREEAIERALSSAQPDEVIAIIGKGDEKFISMQGVTYPYKGDVQVVEDYLSELVV